MLQSPYNILKEVNIANPIEAREGLVEEHDPLSLSIDDEDLAKILEKRIDTAQKFFNERYRLDERRERNERYLFGRQVNANEMASRYRPYEVKYLDNAIYEIEASLKPVALSRMPDMIVLPGNEDPDAEEVAKNMSLVIDTQIKNRENRRKLSLAFKHLPVYFTAILKYKWNPELGEYGDYEFINVHPNNVVIDEQCPVNDANEMDFIAEATKITVQEVIMRFPEKETEFRNELEKKISNFKGKKEWEKMATTIKIWEVWFTWYSKKSDTKWERVEGVLWKYGDCILKKMKNPNFDYKGRETYFTYKEPGDRTTRRESTPDELMMSALQGALLPGMKKETVYRNYFSMPQKPYYFMGYDQWGKVAYDETSRIEQNIYNQENMDSIGKRILEKLKDRGKHVFSKDTGLTGKDLERMDMNNPDQDLLVDGDVNRVHAFIEPPQPSQSEFGEIKLARERMFSLAGATNLNGQLSSDVATSNQIAREMNYTRVDDMTEETINAAAEWMSEAIMQMIKLRYTQDHFVKILGGNKGMTTFIKVKYNMIQDGMEVRIKASGTDKLKRQNNAMEMAKMKLIDPLTFYQDMDLNDPEGRAEKTMMMQMDPQGYFMKYIMKQTPEQAAMNMITGPMPTTGKPPGATPPTGPIGPPPGPPQAPQPGTPQGPNPLNTANVQTAPTPGVSVSPNNGIL